MSIKLILAAALTSATLSATMSAASYADTTSIDTQAIKAVQSTRAEQAIRLVHAAQQKLDIDVRAGVSKDVITADKAALSQATSNFEGITGAKLQDQSVYAAQDMERLVRELDTAQRKLEMDTKTGAPANVIQNDKSLVLGYSAKIKTISGK